MLVDARDLPDGTVVGADVCIIGAGACGITIARELAGGPLEVVVLESGGVEPDAATTDLYRGEMIGEPMTDAFGQNPLGLDEIRLRYLGGTTNHWAGYCRPLEPVDFEERPYLGASGWPITREELDPFYEAAVEVIQIGPYRYDWRWWHEEQGLPPALLDTDAVTTSIFQVGFPRRFGEMYRDELDRAENVRLLTWANVRKLTTTSDGGRVTAADVVTLAGNELSVEASAFVIATGGIEVPRLLLASDDVRPEGLGNEHDLVGRYFAEHLQAVAGFAVVDRDPEGVALYQGVDMFRFPERSEGRYEVKGALTLSPQAVLEEDLLGLEMQLAGTPITNSPHQENGVASTDVAALLDAEGADTRATVYFQTIAEQKPNRESRVRLSTDVDDLGVRRVALDWRHSEEDRASMLRGLELVAAELGSLGIGRLQIAAGGVGIDEKKARGFDVGGFVVDTDAISSADFPVGVGFHHLGTVRMASSPDDGVVDEQCRVHSVENLYVGGSAVFPRGGSATPTFTIVALALRLASHLRDDVLR